MKRFMIIATLLLVATTTIEAQVRIEKRSVGAGEIDYITKEFKGEGLNGIISSLPVVITLVEGEEGDIKVSYPIAEHRYIRCGITNNKFCVGRNGYDKSPKKSILNDRTPIYVTISASKIEQITNHSDMVLHIERDSFANELIIGNGGTGLFVVAQSITAKDKILVISNGTTTFEVKEWNTTALDIVNNAYIHINGATTAKSIQQTNNDIIDVTLKVDCRNISIVDDGKGVVRYKGRADDLMVVSTGKTTIYTSELECE